MRDPISGLERGTHM